MKKRRAPGFKETNLVSKKGMWAVMEEFPSLPFKGRGHERADLALLMDNYRLWAQSLFPRLCSQDVLSTADHWSGKNQIKRTLVLMRDQVSGRPSYTLTKDKDGDEPELGAGAGAGAAGPTTTSAGAAAAGAAAAPRSPPPSPPRVPSRGAGAGGASAPAPAASAAAPAPTASSVPHGLGFEDPPSEDDLPEVVRAVEEEEDEEVLGAGDEEAWADEDAEF